ncbi:hypothetical protein ACQK5W_05365 [Pantoea sp. FN060301]|uniref:hypothetical protein n=1 Tax=Pantoea sp. FN060301 TaxID=3420380 RepID=UPI003D1732B7
MEFKYDEDLASLFIADSNGNVTRVNRGKARSLAEQVHNYIKAVESSGGNKHAAELDVSDATVELLTKIMKSEYSSMTQEFNTALTDEKLALTMFELDKSQEEHAKNLEKKEEEAKTSAGVYTAMSWIVALAAVLIFAGFLFS